MSDFLSRGGKAKRAQSFCEHWDILSLPMEPGQHLGIQLWTLVHLAVGQGNRAMCKLALFVFECLCFGVYGVCFPWCCLVHGCLEFFVSSLCIAAQLAGRYHRPQLFVRLAPSLPWRMIKLPHAHVGLDPIQAQQPWASSQSYLAL